MSKKIDLRNLDTSNPASWPMPVKLGACAILVLLIVGAVYCCLIVLSHYGIITVDWGSFQQILHSLLLNTQTQVESVRQVIQVGLPSAAMGGIGVWRGLKKS